MEHRVGDRASFRRAFALIVVLGLGSAGCGGSKADDAQPPRRASAEKTTTTGTPAGSAPEDGSDERPADPESPDAAPRTSLRANSETPPSVPPADPSEPKLEITAALKESCVRPGGSQTITIRAEPESGVGYDAVYSDGKSGIMEGHYGGNNGGHANDEGVWTDTWVVAPHAPAGKVQVRVLGAKLDYQPGQTEVYFDVAGPTGACT